MTINASWHIDPGHAWLSVPRAEFLSVLEFASENTGVPMNALAASFSLGGNEAESSKMSTKSVFLEEDVAAGVFLRMADEFGFEFNRDSYGDLPQEEYEYAPVRGAPAYDPDLCLTGFEGAHVNLNESDVTSSLPAGGWMVDAVQGNIGLGMDAGFELDESGFVLSHNDGFGLILPVMETQYLATMTPNFELLNEKAAEVEHPSRDFTM